MKKVSKIILINPDKKILLYQRDYRRNISYKGYWDLVGGTGEEGESELDTLERELREELPSCEIKNIWKLRTKYLKQRKIELTHFVGEIDIPEERVIIKEGTGRIKYFTFEEINNIRIPSHHRKFIRKNRKALEI